MERIVIKMTPFVFEDGKTYYFQIEERESTNDYHNLYVYVKKTEQKKFLWRKWEEYRYEQLNSSPELVGVELDKKEICADIKKIIVSKSAKHQIKGWDGFVGNVSDEEKKALLRDSKLKDLLEE